MAQILLKSASFICIILLAYGLKKAGLFASNDYRILTKLILNVTLPASIITSFSTYRVEASLLICTGLGLGINLLVLILARCFSRKNAPASQALWLNGTPSYNIGTFVLPFVQSFLSSGGVVATCLFDTGNAIMCCGTTYALSCGFLGEKGGFSPKEIGRKLLGSVPFIMYVSMLILTLLGIYLPAPVLEFISPAAKAHPFLAMFMIGLMFDIKLEKGMLREVSSILLLRVGIAVAAALACFFLLPLPLEIRQALAITVCGPVSLTGTVFAERAGADPGEAGCLNSLSIPVSIVMILSLLVLFGAA